MGALGQDFYRAIQLEVVAALDIVAGLDAFEIGGPGEGVEKSGVAGFVVRKNGELIGFADRAVSSAHLPWDQVSGVLISPRLLPPSNFDRAKANPRIEKFELQVRSSNTRAIRLYQSFGFVEEGRKMKRLKHGPDQYQDDIYMALWVGN